MTPMTERLEVALRERVPGPVRKIASPGYHLARDGKNAAIARADLASLKREYRQRYGPNLNYTVHPNDEMYLFMQDLWFWEYHVVPMRSRFDAMRTYLVSGDLMMKDLDAILRDQRRNLRDVGSFLEFASGYGRFTRFLVTRVEPSKVTVSDISKPAVDFARRTYGVSGFYSAESAEQLEQDGQFEVIFVASLFSHLAIEHWTPWLARLCALLAPGGLLIFSTHGIFARDEIYGDSWQDRLETKAPGFQYLLTNETNGRLAEDYYGSAFVTEEFVAEQIREHQLGDLRQIYRARLWGSQDVYVLERPTAEA